MLDDPEFNIRFVALVEVHPCLYDVNDANYHRSYVQERTWAKIASKIGDDVTVKECKARWRNLRGRYSKHLRTYDATDVGKRPYYLADFMKFVRPFTKSKSTSWRGLHNSVDHSQAGTEDGSIQYSEVDLSAPRVDIISETEDSNDYVEDMTQDDAHNETVDNGADGKIPNVNGEESGSRSVHEEDNQHEDLESPPMAIDSDDRKGSRDIRNTTYKTRADTSFTKNGDFRQSVPGCYERRKPQLVDSSDSDALFLLSMLPDLRRMNECQKRSFKISLLQLAGEILDDSPPSSKRRRLNDNEKETSSDTFVRNEDRNCIEPLHTEQTEETLSIVFKTENIA